MTQADGVPDEADLADGGVVARRRPVPGALTDSSRNVTVEVATGVPRSIVCICLVEPSGWSTVVPSSKTHSADSTRRLPMYQLRLRPPTRAFFA